MKTARAVSFVAAVALSGSAFAQDGDKPPVAPVPPAAADKAEKHVNKITDAAKDVFAKFEKLIYSPVRQGIKTLSGTVKMDMELPEAARARMPNFDLSFDVAFTAPDQVKVSAKETTGGDAGGMGAMMDQMKGNMTKAVSSIIRPMLGIYHPTDGEFDADATTTDGKTVLTITTYANNVEGGTMAMTLTPEGLPDVGVMTPKPKDKDAPPAPQPGAGRRGRGMMAGGDAKSTIHFVYGDEGGLHRLDKMTVETPGMPGGIEEVLTYADADAGDAKIKVGCRWTMKINAMQNFSFAFTEMSINGKAVTLPKPEAAAPPTPKDDK